MNVEKVTETGCWLYMGALNNTGYGPHRRAYEDAKGPIPPGLVIDHLCRVRSCVNPAHLRAVTPRDNWDAPNSECLSKLKREQTHCRRGHEFTPQNTIRRANGTRLCRECQRLGSAKFYAEHREVRLADQKDYYRRHREERREYERKRRARLKGVLVLLVALLMSTAPAFAQVPAPLPWNDAYWQKVRELTWYAARKNMWVEVVLVETWGTKHALWGDWKLPWPQADIEAAGKAASPEQERWIRKIVSEVGCFGNVIWITDNELDQVNGARREWVEWVASVVRDEEQKTGCGVVHMIGTNAPDFGDSTAVDYVATHKRAPLTEPLHGKWTVNNEHNPSFGPDQEAAYFAQAREKGLGWALWLANLQGADVIKAFERFRDVAKGGQAECFPAPEDDPRWVGGPVKGCPDDLLKALAQAKAEVGDPRPGWQACVKTGETPIACMFPAMDSLAASMRRQGYCAGRTRDAVTAKANDGSTLWYEMHTNGATDGGYTASPCKGSTWRLAQ